MKNLYYLTTLSISAFLLIFTTSCGGDTTATPGDSAIESAENFGALDNLATKINNAAKEQYNETVARKCFYISPDHEFNIDITFEEGWKDLKNTDEHKAVVLLRAAYLEKVNAFMAARDALDALPSRADSDYNDEEHTATYDAMLAASGKRTDAHEALWNACSAFSRAVRLSN